MKLRKIINEAGTGQDKSVFELLFKYWNDFSTILND